MLEDIIKLHRQGRFEEAEKAYRKHIDGHPDDHGAYYMLGGLLFQNDRLPEAVVQFNRAASLAPDRADYLITLAGVQMGLGRNEAARQSLNAAVRLDPNAAPAYTGLARIAAQTGDRGEAEANVRLALRSDPNWIDAQLLAGSLAAERGDHDEAVRLLTRVAEKQPRNAGVQVVLGNALLSQGSAAFAEQAFRNGLALDESLVPARTGLARALMRQGRAEEAFELLREADGGDPEAALTLGQVCIERGDFAGAVRAFGPLHEKAPGATFASEGLAAALLELHRFDEALAVLQSWHDTDPKARGVYTIMVELERRRNNPQGMIDALERWLQIEPEDAEARERLALTLETRDPEGAMRHAEAALEIRSDSPAALLLKGRVMLRGGDAAAARAHLEPLLDSLKTRPAAQALHRALGAVHHALGRREHAAAHWMMAHRLAEQPVVMPNLAAPEALAEVRPEAQQAGQGEPKVVFLALAPGVELVHVGALLGDLGVPVLLDRYALATPRRDGFGDFDAEALAREGLQARAQAFANAYREGLAHTDVDPARPFVDILPALDARWLPLFEQALPGARVLIVRRGDARDAFLNWLACGSPPQPPLTEDKLGAVRLYLALAHLRHAATFPSVRVLDLDQLLATDALPADVMELFARDGAPQLVRFRSSLSAVAGLPTWLGAGAWRDYCEVLPAAMSILDDAADAPENPE